MGLGHNTLPTIDDGQTGCNGIVDGLTPEQLERLLEWLDKVRRDEMSPVAIAISGALSLGEPETGTGITKQARSIQLFPLESIKTDTQQ